MKSMSGTEETLRRLAAVPSLQVSRCVPLSRYTRFGIGGPADIFAETREVEAFIAAMHIAQSSGLDVVVIGGGTNLIVSDSGFRGVALRLIADRLMAAGNGPNTPVVNFLTSRCGISQSIRATRIS